MGGLTSGLLGCRSCNLVCTLRSNGSTRDGAPPCQMHHHPSSRSVLRNGAIAICPTFQGRRVVMCYFFPTVWLRGKKVKNLLQGTAWLNSAQLGTPRHGWARLARVVPAPRPCERVARVVVLLCRGKVKIKNSDPVFLSSVFLVVGNWVCIFWMSNFFLDFKQTSMKFKSGFHFACEFLHALFFPFFQLFG